MLKEKITIFIKKHYLAVIFFFLVGAISVSQQIFAIYTLGEEYKSVPFIYTANADVYLAKMREIFEGHGMVASPYFYEYKNTAPLILPTGEYIYSLPKIIFGLSLTNTVIFNQFLFPAFLFLIIYYLIFQLTGNLNLLASKINAIAGGLFVTLGYNFIDWRSAWLVLSGQNQSLHTLLWNRPVNPITGEVLLFLLLIFLWLIIDNKRKNYFWLPAGIVSGLAIGYFFSWFLGMAVTVALVIIFSVKKEWQTVKKLLLVVLTSFLATSYFWLGVIKLIIFNQGDSDRAGRNGAFFTHQPVINKNITALFIIFLLFFLYAYYRKRKNKEKLENWWWFSLAVFLACQIAFNHQVITGVDIWHHHFVQFTIPLGITVFMVLLFNYVKNISFKIWLTATIFIIFLTLTFGAITSRSYVYAMADFKAIQRYETIFSWLNDNAESDCVVLTKEGVRDRINRLIPAFTSCNSYAGPGGYDLEAPEERRYHNFLVLLRINNVKPEGVESYLKNNYNLITEFFFKDWRQAFVGSYDSTWMDEIIKQTLIDYNIFYKNDFRNELNKYKLDYIIAAGDLDQGVKESLPGLKPLIKIDNQFYIYQF